MTSWERLKDWWTRERNETFSVLLCIAIVAGHFISRTVWGARPLNESLLNWGVATFAMLIPLVCVQVGVTHRGKPSIWSIVKTAAVLIVAGQVLRTYFL